MGLDYRQAENIIRSTESKKRTFLCMFITLVLLSMLYVRTQPDEMITPNTISRVKIGVNERYVWGHIVTDTEHRPIRTKRLVELIAKYVNSCNVTKECTSLGKDKSL